MSKKNIERKWTGETIFSVILLIVSVIAITVTGILFRQSL